jgi:Leucine-rich repeat (LRR) protein
LDQFSSLKSLDLYELHSLEYISERDKSEDGLSDSSFLPSLETLTISGCPNLKGWWRGRRDSVEEIGITTPITSNPLNYSFPRLSRLYIWDCPQLTYMPLFPYLEDLTLCKCSLKPLEQTMRMGMINMTASPSISSSSSIFSFAALSKLNCMWIQDMDEALPEELLRNLISLRTLDLHGCPLPPQGMRYLTALQSLDVWRSEVVDPFNDWDEMEWQGLSSLLSLEFDSLPELVSLPIGLQHLTSLQTLNIWDCPSLTSLPEWIGGLTSLQTLHIRRCTILSERCKREIGEDWPKIAKIPDLYVYSPRDSDKKKAALKNRNLIKSFGCCNCSTTDGTS